MIPKKIYLLLSIFILGLFLFLYSWYITFPISINSANDLVFNHVPSIYWLSLVLVIISMYLMAVYTKNKLCTWILTVGIVWFFFSISYFFNLLPGSDSPYFRGLMDYFLKTNSLNASLPGNLYFQWPAFFVSTKTETFASGLSLIQLEFLKYAIIGLLLSTALFIYAYRFWKNKSPIPVIAFFIISFSFLNYQDVPFSLALGLLFIIIFVIENKPKNWRIVLLTLILFTSISLTHLFVPLFYVLYLLLMAIIRRKKEYGALFLFTSTIYLAVQLSFASQSFVGNINGIFIFPSDFSLAVNRTFIAISNPFDQVMQLFTRITTFSLFVTSFISFAVLAYKRKIRDVDKALFLTGTIYLIIGVILYTLGTRAIPLLLIPICLGTFYFFEFSNKKYLKVLFIILLAFSISIPIHSTLSNSYLMFQTNEGYIMANFIIENYNWTSYTTLLLDTSMLWYIYPQVVSNATLVNVYSSFYESNISNYNCIIYSIRLQNELDSANASATETSSKISDYSVIYTLGDSYMAIKR
jgi:hypothetical protein